MGFAAPRSPHDVLNESQVLRTPPLRQELSRVGEQGGTGRAHNRPNTQVGRYVSRCITPSVARKKARKDAIQASCVYVNLYEYVCCMCACMCSRSPSHARGGVFSRSTCASAHIVQAPQEIARQQARSSPFGNSVALRGTRKYRIIWSKSYRVHDTALKTRRNSFSVWGVPVATLETKSVHLRGGVRGAGTFVCICCWGGVIEYHRSGSNFHESGPTSSTITGPNVLNHGSSALAVDVSYCCGPEIQRLASVVPAVKDWSASLQICGDLTHCCGT